MVIIIHTQQERTRLLTRLVMVICGLREPQAKTRIGLKMCRYFHLRNVCHKITNESLPRRPWTYAYLCTLLHLSVNREGRWGTPDDITITFFLFLCPPPPCPLELGELQACPFSDLHDVFTPLLVSALSSSSFHCTLQDGLARPNERETWPYHCSLRLFTIVRSSCGPIACWILARTSSLVTWSLYEMRSSLPHFHDLYSSSKLCCKDPWFTSIQEDGCDKRAHQSYHKIHGSFNRLVG